MATECDGRHGRAAHSRTRHATGLWRWVVSPCALLGAVFALLVLSASALAAAPEAPETGKAGGVTATTATLEGGVLNPHAAGGLGEYPGESQYEYRVSETECEGESATAPEPALGFEKEAVLPVALSSLQPNAHYTFCLFERNAAREQSPASPLAHFTTEPAPPTADAEGASGINAHEATLEAQINANNQETTYSFEYATSEAALGTPAATSVAGASALPAGFGDQAASVSTGALLTQLTTYYYRVIAENVQSKKEGKPVDGNIEHFKTSLEPPTTSPATGITTSAAMLHGVLNPAAAGEVGIYEFRYRASATECQGEGEQSTPTPAGTMIGGKEQAVAAEAAPLEPGLPYTVCLVVKDAAGEIAISAPITFRALAVPPVVSGENATQVTATSAKLNGQIDPGGAETTYHFQYGTTTSYGQDTPESAPVGADNSNHASSAAIQGLQASTIYHYRLVASNEQAPGGTPGPDETFTTQATEGAAVLPDGRAYELVSPPEKDGGEVLGIGGGGLTVAGGDATQASEDGKAVSYIATAPAGANPRGNNLSTQIFSTRDAGGWASQDISPPHPNPIEFNHLVQQGEEFATFSSNLSRAILMTPHSQAEPPLAPELNPAIQVEGPSEPPELPYGHEIYVRNDQTGVFQAVQTSEPLPQIAFEGGSPDLSHIVFEGPAGLDPKYPNAGGLYEWAAGRTQLVSVLPDNTPAPSPSLLGDDFLGGFGAMRLSATMHAISDDGSRVVWGTNGTLYTRDMASGETTAIGAGEFRTASSDGSRVFYNNGDLVVFDVAHNTNVDLGITAQPIEEGHHHPRVPFLAANERSTSVFEISPAILTGIANPRGEKAVAEAENLYVLRETPVGGGSWSTTFVTARAEEGTNSHASGTTHAPFITQELRASPSGRYLAFMSQQSLTGYDNHDANSGQPDEEVFLYDAQLNALVCASCNPTGARPVGEQDQSKQFPPPAMDPSVTWESRWLAATIPGWTPDGGENTTGYQPRFLSDSGRLFFNSADSLVPQDVNGRNDVYQYEPTGIGSCQPPSYGLGRTVVRDLAASGCVGLISAGTGNTDSTFFDASASGNDVFFTTQDGLVSSDRDGTNDMYDARVCSPAEPCATSIASPPPCSTADSCRPAPSPQPGIFAAPASSTFAGAGNVTVTTPRGSTPKKTAKCTKGRKRSHGRCVKSKRKKITTARRSGGINRRSRS